MPESGQKRLPEQSGSDSTSNNLELLRSENCSQPPLAVSSGVRISHARPPFWSARSRSLVGIFVARYLFEFALLLDEGIDLGVCECQRMNAGGTLCGGGLPWLGPPIQTMTLVPLTRSPWVEASLTEEWMCSVYGPPKGKWRAITFDGR
jgi:hypothetical protein